MLPLCEFIAESTVLYDQEDLLRELLSYDMLCPSCNLLSRDELGSFRFLHAPSPLHWSRQFEWPWALHQLNLQPHHDCLDIGSGWSVLKFALAKRASHVTCLELDANSIELAQKTIVKLGQQNKITQVQGDLRKLPFPDESFHRVTSISVLEHVPCDHIEGIKEMLRCLKKGGSLLLTMDVRLKGSELTTDFYVDLAIINKICNEFSLVPSSSKNLAVAKIVDTDVDIVVIMMRLIK
jgi:2-polyprenyl-3-methyl-5-hydroxy-6-metoxy-1,4-benzoquinol methylase